MAEENAPVLFGNELEKVGTLTTPAPPKMEMKRRQIHEIFLNKRGGHGLRNRGRVRNPLPTVFSDFRAGGDSLKSSIDGDRFGHEPGL